MEYEYERSKYGGWVGGEGCKCDGRAAGKVFYDGRGRTGMHQRMRESAYNAFINNNKWVKEAFNVRTEVARKQED